MDSRVWNSMFLKVLCVILVLISPESFAFSQKVLEQSPENIKVGLVTVAIVVALLMLLAMILKIQLGNLRKKQQKHSQELADKQSLLKNL